MLNERIGQKDKDKESLEIEKNREIGIHLNKIEILSNKLLDYENNSNHRNKWLFRQ